jgi:maleylacetate reductase
VVETGVYRFPRMDRIIFGEPWAEALAGAVALIGARRVFVLGGSTLFRTLPLAEELSQGLGERLAGIVTGIRPHTPREDVIKAAEAARAASADLVVTVGSGSVTDAGKMILLCLAADIRSVAALDDFRAPVWRSPEQAIPSFPVRMLAVPTTLSGGEFTAFAGCTDLARQAKESYGHPQMIPNMVVLDPRLTVHTPMWLWLSTGLRAVDHACETLCAVRLQPLFEAAARRALELIVPALPRTKQDPADLDARLDSMLGVWLSIIAGQAGSPMGASHAIGHVLGGTAGVPHGYTSCIMLPHVLHWNKAVNADRQRLIAAAFGQPEADAGDLVAALVRRLGLPSTLREAGVAREQLPLIAEHSMHDRWISSNPRQISGPGDVMHLLELAF